MSVLRSLTAAHGLNALSGMSGPSGVVRILARLGGLAVLSISCALPAPRPALRVGLPAIPPSLSAFSLSAPAAFPASVAIVDPVPAAPAPVAPEPAPALPAPAAPPAPEVAQPLAGAEPFMPEVERWRGLVRHLVAEARAEGRLEGPASRLNEDLALAVIEQESGGDPDAESWAGAMGLMQLMPESFAWIMGLHDWGDDVSDISDDMMRDPTTNLRAGVRFLAAVLEEQSGSIYWALASYNAGGGMVNAWRAAGYAAAPDSYGGGETASYAPAILGNYAAHHSSTL